MPHRSSDTSGSSMARIALRRGRGSIEEGDLGRTARWTACLVCTASSYRFQDQAQERKTVKNDQRFAIFTKHSAKYDMVPQRVLHYFSIIAEMQILHNSVLVKCHGTSG